MRSLPRFWLTATVVVLLSLAPKAVLGILRARAPATTPPNQQLRAFLVSASGGPVEPIRAEGGKEIAGWRFGSAECVGQAFLSGLPGVLDYEAHAHAPDGARILYAYGGAVTDRPPSGRLAVDVMAFRLIWEFLPTKANEPRYLVLVYPRACAAPPALPWDSFRLN